MIADSPGIQKHIINTYQVRPVYIPYGADVFSNPDPSVLKKYGLDPHEYFLMITRMEPENNIEMVIKGYLSSGHSSPLFIMGNIKNKFGQYVTSAYKHPNILFSDAVYDQSELDNLRFYSSIYFHGHSVGGTNPSLLEAMACGCRIVAHDNQFNRAVLENEADYFPDANHVAELLNSAKDPGVLRGWKKLNLEKILTIYNQATINDAYEMLMLESCGQANIIIQPAVAEAV